MTDETIAATSTSGTVYHTPMTSCLPGYMPITTADGHQLCGCPKGSDTISVTYTYHGADIKHCPTCTCRAVSG